MKLYPAYLTFVLIGIVFFCGCTETIQEVTPSINATPVPITNPVSVSSTKIPSDIPPRYPVVVSSDDVKITIHSAMKNTKIKTMNSYRGNILVVINLTIENLAEQTPLVINEKTIGITKGGPVDDPIYKDLENPFHWGSIPPKGEKTGEIVFGTNMSIEKFNITLMDEEGNRTFSKYIGIIPAGIYGSPKNQP